MCRPVSYRASTIVNTATHRVTKWVAGATLLSCVVNAPRFFETKLVWKSFSTTSASNYSEALHKLSFEVTNMRRDPNYIRYDQTSLYQGVPLVSRGIILGGASTSTFGKKMKI